MRLEITFISSYDSEKERGFTREEFDDLRKQGVDMDDWDYAIITDPSVLEEEEYEDDERQWVWYDHVPEEERVWPRRYITETSWTIDPPSYHKGRYETVTVKMKRYNCVSYALDRMLTGCCSNEWYLIEWKGEKKAIGLAYHA